MELIMAIAALCAHPANLEKQRNCHKELVQCYEAKRARNVYLKFGASTILSDCILGRDRKNFTEEEVEYACKVCKTWRNSVNCDICVNGRRKNE